ncbi:MAG: hypothetical protein AMK71_10120 [Nitrospira bacterium SG8_35_4]|nr:MAG: hypothetical protein AMK71_10120 [Nitrospira bacterium SG8_35_4]
MDIKFSALPNMVQVTLLFLFAAFFMGCGSGGGGGGGDSIADEVGSPQVVDSGTVLSTAPVGETDGENAFKGKLLSLTYKTGGGYEKPLVVVYGDAAGPDVRDFNGKVHPARDIFVTRSADSGSTWSQPVNISNMANLHSALTDHDGDAGTLPEPYYGDTDKPMVFANGSSIVVMWGSKYCPGRNQGTIVYPDAGSIELPYSCIYISRSSDGGLTWSSPEQLSDGYRDAKQYNVRASAAGFVLLWQEDPLGLQPGEAMGPGDGGSGAKVSKGTDIWYSALTKSAFDAGAPFPLSVRVTDNFTAFDAHGFESGTVGASRPNMMLIGNTLIIAYEEMKGTGKPDPGKYIRYHVFAAFDDPASDLTAGEGWIISDPAECARRVRFFTQDKAGPNSGVRLVFLWRQGTDTQGGPSDIMSRVGIQDTTVDPASTGFRPDDLYPAVDPLSTDPAFAANNAPPMNLSSDRGINSSTGDNPKENAMAHRGIMRGDFISVGYSWTADLSAAGPGGQENYNFYITRSFDGGMTWDARRNISNITDRAINVKEPRIVGTPSSPDPSDVRNTNVYYVAWSTELKQNPLQPAESIDLDIFYTKTVDRGDSYTPALLLAEGANAQAECQLNLSPDGGQMHAIWMETSPGGTTDVLYRYAGN